MIDAFDWVIGAYGKEITCYNNEEEDVGHGMAIVLPMTKADWTYTSGQLGEYSPDMFLGLAEPDIPLDQIGEDGWIIFNDEKYEILMIRPIVVGRDTTHQWVALRHVEEVDEEEEVDSD